MHYTELFRRLREARGLTIEQLARISRRHRNTVLNVESGRPVKFKTLSRFLAKMGYGPDSPEARSVALLWLESVSGISFSEPAVEAAARKAIVSYRATSRDAARELERTVARAGLDRDQIALLAFAARRKEALSILEIIRKLAAAAEADDESLRLKAAED